MFWKIESVSDKTITGWIYDADNPDIDIEVAALKGQSLLSIAVANQPSQSVSAAVKGKPNCGFSISWTGDACVDDVMLICMNWPHSTLGLIIHSSDKEFIGKLLPSYQKFEGVDAGSFSNTFAKLESLMLPDLANKSVLDIGCNEGFFCFHAMDKGASRVVGIDKSELFIEKAKRRAQKYAEKDGANKLEFRCGSWWDLPDEKFDIILFLSAVHYESRQKELFDHLLNYLTPNGGIVLECGVLPGSQCHTMKVGRANDVCRYPSENYLVNTLLKSYATKFIGASVVQAGDPVPRKIYYCFARRTTVGVIRGQSQDGKTFLAQQFSQRGFSSFSSDVFLSCCLNRASNFPPPDTALYRMIRSTLDGLSLNTAAPKIVKIRAVEEFCRDFVDSLPWHEDLFFVEGEIFRHDVFYEELVKQLKGRKCIVWDITRA